MPVEINNITFKMDTTQTCTKSSNVFLVFVILIKDILNELNGN